MTAAGSRYGYAAVYNWVTARREAPVGELALLLRVVGATDEERLLVLDLAELDVRASTPVAA